MCVRLRTTGTIYGISVIFFCFFFGLLKLTRDVGAVRRRRRPCGGFVKRLMVCLRGHMPPRLYGHEHVRTR